jgi:hypothetical protein
MGNLRMKLLQLSTGNCCVQVNVFSVIDTLNSLCLANPMYDLCNFMIQCTNADIRKGCEKGVIDFYYDELCRHYKDYNSKPNFSREQVNLRFFKALLLLLGS